MALMLWGSLLTAAAVCQAVRADPAPNDAVPAVWQSYDISVHLIRLPRPYTCDQLWSKFRSVLLALGAGRVDSIVPSECASDSPSVHVQFVLPRPVSGADSQYEDIQAIRRVIELRPGEPSLLSVGDCRLVQEMRESLFRDLPLKVVNAQFNCARPAASGDPHATSSMAHPEQAFALRVQAAMPIWPGQSARTKGSGA